MLYALVPPYGTLLEPPDVPALGTLLVADTVHGAEDAAWALDEAVARAPWCVPCLVARARETVAFPHHIHGARLAMIRLPGEASLTPAPILRSVRLRVRPWPEDFADYVAERLCAPDLAPALEELFLRPTFALGEESTLSGATRDALFHAGRLKPHEWHQLGALAEIAGSRSVDTPLSGTQVQALRVLLGVPQPAYRERLGWEWVLERGLRAAGYLGTGRLTPAGYPLSTT